MKKEIHKILVLSTGHLPQTEFEALESWSHEVGFTVMKHEFGTIVNLHDTEKDCITERKEQFPKLSKLIDYADTEGIKYMNFDQDGNLYDEFEQFDW